MVTLLCIVSGSLDAISFLAFGEAFGEAFASVMTGNIVFMGVAAGTLNSRLGLFCGVAIAGYVIGVLSGSRLAHRWKRQSERAVWPARVTKILVVQFGVLSIVAVMWFVVDGEPSEQAELLFLLPAACIMGIQSAAVRAIGVPVSTTYMTGALTTLLEAIVTRRPFSSTESSAVGGILALATGALFGSLVLTFFSPAAMLVPTVTLGTVILIWMLRDGTDRPTTVSGVISKDLGTAEK